MNYTVDDLYRKGGVSGTALYGAGGPGVLTFWEVEQMLAAARKRPVRECFLLKEGEK